MKNHPVLPKARDMHRIFRLIHELCEIGNSTRVWREQMMVAMEEMCHATMSVSYSMRFSLNPKDMAPKTLVYIERGMNAAWTRYIGQGDLRADPMTPLIMKRFGTDFTVTRSDWIRDSEWYESKYFKTVRIPSNIDATIYSQVAIREPSVIDGFSLCRPLGEPNFTPYEVTLVRFLHQELAALWNRPDPVGANTLPPQQRKVLEAIRNGQTRRQIAQRLQLSENTIHTYERKLFARANVKSRAELLAVTSRRIQPNLMP